MANASGSPTQFYSPTKLVKNIQLSFGLAFHPEPGTPVEERRIQMQQHMQLMDNLQFGLKYFTKLISLNVFIPPAMEDPFGLIRMGNILHEDSPPQPVVLCLKMLTDKAKHKVCNLVSLNGKHVLSMMAQFHTKDWEDSEQRIPCFHNISKLQIITIQEAGNPDEMGNMVKSWALKCEGKLSKIDVWTGAHDRVQCGDFAMLPHSGPQRSGHTFTSEQVDGVWKHRIFVLVSH